MREFLFQQQAKQACILAPILSVLLPSTAFGQTSGAVTTDISEAITAGRILDDMSREESHGYIAGVVEGLAYARFLMDGKTEDGMICIYDWFYEGDGTQTKIIQAFERFRDFPAGPILWTMSKQVCGD